VNSAAWTGHYKDCMADEVFTVLDTAVGNILKNYVQKVHMEKSLEHWEQCALR